MFFREINASCAIFFLSSLSLLNLSTPDGSLAIDKMTNLMFYLECATGNACWEFFVNGIAVLLPLLNVLSKEKICFAMQFYIFLEWGSFCRVRKIYFLVKEVLYKLAGLKKRSSLKTSPKMGEK